ncbi:methyltransferase domain-containing protein [Niveispirillum sp. SYP-B3756]|uniref:methyltransferase domain-containing protein n=1 Tax=Niveispirillum sp. SYP-B3756 TaxID=2662178 RepID=UPI0012916ABA|nr:methyltransferase domain-containing protein [Niveispirillum sp. SYP-B3756]MQP64173.1 methyltransferase domain-containing protein [Niveispirillum sp. SYP-B3756]
MYSDVLDLRDFYQGSTGQMVRRLIRRRIRALWPDVNGLRVLGIGYATPYLGMFKEEAERVMAVMPASQGVIGWPPAGPGRVTLADEAELPFPDMSIDRVLLIHGLECTEELRPLMRELWRILAGGGRLITVAPNRRGIWARSDRTPFGMGSPFSPSQLKRTLQANMFVPEREDYALFLPPTESRFLLASAGAVEELGRRWFRAFAGVHMIEASKQIYASAARAKQKERHRLLSPAAQPVFGRLVVQRSEVNKEEE